jgi:hypothetical protein
VAGVTLHAGGRHSYEIGMIPRHTAQPGGLQRRPLQRAQSRMLDLPSCLAAYRAAAGAGAASKYRQVLVPKIQCPNRCKLVNMSIRQKTHLTGRASAQTHPDSRDAKRENKKTAKKNCKTVIFYELSVHLLI